MANNFILITGSSKGIGKNLAIEFSRLGFNVIIHGRNKKNLDEVKNLVNKNNAECMVIKGDITDKNTINTLAKKAEEKNIDILINNAGIYYNSGFENISLNKYKEIMEVNFFSSVSLTKKILPIFVNKNSGLIVNINSLAGKQGASGESAYSASKHALKGFSDSLKYEVVKQGIKIMDFYIGAVATDITKKRKNGNLLIQPKDLAKYIVSACKDYPSLTISETNILRCKYE